MLPTNLKEDLGFVMSLLKLELKDRLVVQGHGRRSTSKLISSIDFDIKVAATILVGSMYMEDYYVFVDKGVKASRIPYKRGGPQRGGTSKYIQGLIRYFRLKRGLNPTEAKRAAFATANKHKQEGMPTRASFKYSRDGTRLGFLTDTLKKYDQDAVRILERRVGDSAELTLTTILNEIQKELV